MKVKLQTIATITIGALALTGCQTPDFFKQTSQTINMPTIMVNLDSDGDGVTDDIDQCPGTPLGAKVNAVGCWVLGDLLFDFDKSEIKSAGFQELDDVIVVLNKNPELKIELQGHTDNKGSKLYNDKLSLRRANAVKTYLEEKGIPSDSLTTKAFGFSKPVSTNETTSLTTWVGWIEQSNLSNRIA